MDSETSQMKKAYRVAVFCGALPLLIGVAIFLAWVVSDRDWLMGAGMVAILGGVVFFSAGVISLGRWYWLAFHAFGRTRCFWIKTAACAFLLFANFPSAIGIMFAVGAIDSCYTVVIHNASTIPIEKVQVSGGGCFVDFGSVRPGGIAKRSFWIQREGELEIQGKAGDVILEKMIDGYVCPSMGGRTDVTIGHDSRISINAESRRKAPEHPHR